MCSLWNSTHTFIYLLFWSPFLFGYAMPQVIRRRPLAAESLVRSQIRSCGMCGGHNGAETGFPPEYFGFLCQYLFTNAPYPSTRRTNGWSLGTFQTSVLCRKSQGLFTLIIIAAFSWMDFKKEKCSVSTVGRRAGFEYRTSENEVCLCFCSVLVLRKTVCLPIRLTVVWKRIRNTAGHFSSWLLVSGGNVYRCRPADRDGGDRSRTGHSRRGLTLGCE